MGGSVCGWVWDQFYGVGVSAGLGWFEQFLSSFWAHPLWSTGKPKHCSVTEQINMVLWCSDCGKASVTVCFPARNQLGNCFHHSEVSVNVSWLMETTCCSVYSKSFKLNVTVTNQSYCKSLHLLIINVRSCKRRYCCSVSVSESVSVGAGHLLHVWSPYDQDLNKTFRFVGAKVLISDQWSNHC